VVELMAVFLVVWLSFYLWVVHVEPRRRRD